MKNIFSAIMAALILSLCNMGIANALQNVIINGVRMNSNEISFLEKWHCGPFPSGNYWLNFTTGVWGYTGNSYPQGNITDNCRHKSLSERRRLYRPGELLQ